MRLMPIITAFAFLFILGCSSITEEDARAAALAFYEPIAEETMKNMFPNNSDEGDLLYVLESSRTRGGYCVELAFTYRKEIGLPARETNGLFPSTIPLFVDNDGKVDEEDDSCFYRAYPGFRQ